MKTRTLNKHEIKEINNKLFEYYGVRPLSKKDRVVEIEGEMVFIKVNDEVCFFYHEDKIVPTLKRLLHENFLKKITVDMGAVKFVVSGADIMRPGVVNIEDNIKKGGLIVIIDENNKKPLAVGSALFDSMTMQDMEAGKCIKNIHYIGDRIWNLI